MRRLILSTAALALLVSTSTTAEAKWLRRPSKILQTKAEEPKTQAPAPSPDPDVPAGERVPDPPADPPSQTAAEPSLIFPNAPANAEICCVCPQWYSQVDILFLDRNIDAGNQPIVLDDLTGAVLLSTGDLSFNGQTAPRILLGCACDDCSACEFIYFGAYGFSADRAVFGPNNLDIPPVLVVPATDFDNAQAMRISYDSRFHSVEANCNEFICGSRPCGGLELIAGLRYINLYERFDINSTDDDGTISDYLIHAKNDLYGGQLGLRCTEYCGCWGLVGTAKFGLFANDARQNQFVGDNGNTTVLRSTRSAQTLTAFVADLNATATCRLNDHISLRAGYSLIIVEGVALAPTQLDFSFNALSGTGVNNSGGLILHGTNLGVEFRW